MNATTTIVTGGQTRRVATAGLLATAVVLTATMAWAVLTFQGGGSSTERVSQGAATLPTESYTISEYVEALAGAGDQLAGVWGRPVVAGESGPFGEYVEALAESTDQLAAVWGNNVLPGSDVDLEALTRAIAETHERILAADQ
jgi:hypothetical protein